MFEKEQQRMLDDGIAAEDIVASFSRMPVLVDVFKQHLRDFLGTAVAA